MSRQSFIESSAYYRCTIALFWHTATLQYIPIKSVKICQNKKKYSVDEFFRIDERIKNELESKN